MLQNEIEHKRLTSFDDEINGRTIHDILLQMFQHTNRTAMSKEKTTKFLEDYEVFERNNQLCFIVRGVKLRLKKYYYLPPAYILFDLNILHNASKYVQPQNLRFVQKLSAISYLVQENKTAPERAYFLEKHPFQTFYHPHIDSIGHACYGHWIEELDNTKDMYHFMESVRAFLHDYNYRSTFFNINPYDWDPINRYKIGPYLFTNRAYFELVNEMYIGDDIIHDFCADCTDYAPFRENEHFIKELIAWHCKPNRHDWLPFFAQKLVEYGLIDSIEDCLINDYTKEDMLEGVGVDFSNDFWDMEGVFGINRIGDRFGNWWIDKSFGTLMLKGDALALQHGIRTWQFINNVGKTTHDDGRQRYSELSRFIEGWEMNSREVAFYLLMNVADTDLTGLLTELTKYKTAWDNQFSSSTYGQLRATLTDALDFSQEDISRGKWFNRNVFVDRNSISINECKFIYKDLDYTYVVARQIMARLKATVEDIQSSDGRPRWETKDAKNAIISYLNDDVDKKVKKMKPIILTMDEAYKKCLGIMWNTNRLVSETTNQIIMEETGYNMRNLPLGGDLERIPFEYDTVLDFIRGVVLEFPDKLEDFAPFLLERIKSIIELSLLEYLEVCTIRKKEVEDVLKHTLPNMEQSELLSEEVPQS